MIINQVKQKLHLVGYLLIRYFKDARYHERKILRHLHSLLMSEMSRMYVLSHCYPIISKHVFIIITRTTKQYLERLRDDGMSFCVLN